MPEIFALHPFGRGHNAGTQVPSLHTTEVDGRFKAHGARDRSSKQFFRHPFDIGPVDLQQKFVAICGPNHAGTTVRVEDRAHFRECRHFLASVGNQCSPSQRDLQKIKTPEIAGIDLDLGAILQGVQGNVSATNMVVPNRKSRIRVTEVQPVIAKRTSDDRSGLAKVFCPQERMRLQQTCMRDAAVLHAMTLHASIFISSLKNSIRNLDNVVAETGEPSGHAP